MTNSQSIKNLVDRFLAWPLPESVCSDLCATKQGYPHRSGTSLLSADEARQMLEYLLADLIPTPDVRLALETSTQLLWVLHAAFKTAAEHPEAARKSELDYWQPRDKATRIAEQLGYNEAALRQRQERKP